jgi:RNA polymerase sigma factor (sigma-70 family)
MMTAGNSIALRRGSDLVTDDLETAAFHRLWARMQQGDREAREELLRLVWDRAERTCRKMLDGFPVVRSREEAADVLHAALLRLLHSLEQLPPASKRDFFNLVNEHIRRTLLDLHRYHRASRRRPADGRVVVRLAPGSEEDAVSLDPPAAHDEPELERWRAFHEAVAELPTEQREVFGLVFYNGWSFAQIKELFQVSEKTVRRRWRAARLRLRERLRGELPAF